MSGPRLPLAGMHILITRPLSQAQANADALVAMGARVSVVPLLELLPHGDAASHALPLTGASFSTLFVFVSGNAVRHGLPVLAGLGFAASAITAAAVGAATRDALVAAGAREVLAPTEGFDSEALLAVLAAVPVAGRTVVIVRGTGEEQGRSLLGDTLAARGADVRYLECYRRVLPAQSPAALQQLLSEGPVDAISVMSVETVKHLFHAAGPRGYERITQTLLAVPHARVAAAARALGAQKVMVIGVGAASLEGMLALAGGTL
jgi:uroporphyrinogen-III synthase